MQIDVRWHKPIVLRNGRKQHLVYTVDGLDQWAGMTGVYVFARQFGTHLIPLYIGKANDVAKRIEQHLNTTKLMLGIKQGVDHDDPPGRRVVVAGEFLAKPGQSKGSCISIIESALIAHALASGYSLLNIKGTKRPAHDIDFVGYLGAKKFTGKQLRVSTQ